MSAIYRNKPKAPGTLLAAVEASLLAAARYHAGVEEKPAAVLWTDADGQWQPVVKKLQERLPQLVAHGAYAAAKLTGPAVWLKCVVARTIDLGFDKDAVPIVYLPNISRQTLRAAADCPPLLQPLVEPLAESRRQLEDPTIRVEHDNVARGIEHRGANLARFKMCVDLSAQFHTHLAIDVGGDVLPHVFAVDPHLPNPNSLPRLGANPFNRGARLRCKSALAR